MYLGFGEYIKILRKEIKGVRSERKFVIDLVKAANDEVGKRLSETTVKNWIQNNNKGYEGYFKNDNGEDRYFNDEKFIKYLKIRASDDWKNIQFDFANIGEKHIINCDTADIDEFFKSVMYQFKKFCGVPYDPFEKQKKIDSETKKSAEPNLNTGAMLSAKIKDNKFLKNLTTAKDIIDIFNQAVRDNDIVDFMDNAAKLADESLDKTFDEYIGRENIILLDKKWVNKVRSFLAATDKISYPVGMLDAPPASLFVEKIDKFTDILEEYLKYLGQNITLISKEYINALRTIYKPDDNNQDNILFDDTAWIMLDGVPFATYDFEKNRFVDMYDNEEEYNKQRDDEMRRIITTLESYRFKAKDLYKEICELYNSFFL